MVSVYSSLKRWVFTATGSCIVCHEASGMGFRVYKLGGVRV